MEQNVWSKRVADRNVRMVERHRARSAGDVGTPTIRPDRRNVNTCVRVKEPAATSLQRLRSRGPGVPRGRFTLLDFKAGSAVAGSPASLRSLHVVGRPTGPDDLADTEGQLARAYGATDGTLVLIRPDGYVAMISDAGDVSAIATISPPWVERWFRPSSP